MNLAKLQNISQATIRIESLKDVRGMPLVLPSGKWVDLANGEWSQNDVAAHVDILARYVSLGELAPKADVSEPTLASPSTDAAKMTDQVEITVIRPKKSSKKKKEVDG